MQAATCLRPHQQAPHHLARTLRSSTRQSEIYPLSPMSKNWGRDCPGFPQCIAAPANRSISLQQRSPEQMASAQNITHRSRTWKIQPKMDVSFARCCFATELFPQGFLVVRVVATKKMSLTRPATKRTGLKAHSRHRLGHFVAPPLLGST